MSWLIIMGLSRVTPPNQVRATDFHYMKQWFSTGGREAKSGGSLSLGNTFNT